MPSEPADSAQESPRNELVFLRQELQELKRCQLHYFTLSISGTAAILGFAGSINTKELVGPSLLAPLVIIIPCWWIFFDKATTITRIVGYVRILENLLAGGARLDLIYPGYEEALTLYREYEDDLRRGGRRYIVEASTGRASSVSHVREWFDLIALRTRHRYWMVNFYTFAGLAALCCASGWWLPSVPRPDERFRYVSVGFGVFVTLVSVIYSIIVVHQLTFGKRSYASSAIFWRETLDKKRFAQAEQDELKVSGNSGFNHKDQAHVTA
jgi:hypothetical protein